MKLLITLIITLLICAASVSAQNTKFTCQGRLLDNSLPPTANYDFEFRLLNADTGGILLGTQTRSAVPVANGVLTGRLDFGDAAFREVPRFLEISVKPAGALIDTQQKQIDSLTVFTCRSNPSAEFCKK